jgi:hypothetical protein
MDYPVIHQYNKHTRLIKITIGQLLDLPIENWKHNRPPDEFRVAEIVEYIIEQDNEILQPLYIHYNSKIGVYEMLDGIHRYSAMKNVKGNPLISDKAVFVHLFVDLTYGKLIDIFQNLNKTLPVPELYMNPAQDNVNQKQIIEEIVKEWKKNYKGHFSNSNNYTIPNINDTSFTNILSDLYTSYKVRSKAKLLERIERANTNIKAYIIADDALDEIPIKFSDKQKKKCRDSGCYLFLYKDIAIVKYFIGKE